MDGGLRAAARTTSSRLETLSQFLQFVRGSQFRFYQERDIGLDLYHCGLPGILLGALVVATVLVFLLAIFHAIPARRHVLGLLLGFGFSALLLGAGTSFFNFKTLPEREARVIRGTAGPQPANEAQRAAVIALPLVLGAGTFAAGALGCLYMAVFWSRGIPASEKRPGSRPSNPRP